MDKTIVEPPVEGKKDKEVFEPPVISLFPLETMILSSSCDDVNGEWSPTY